MEFGLGQDRDYSIEERADAIAISLSENPDSDTANGLPPSWRLDVYAATDEGEVYVGSLNTVAAINGPFPARLVGYAVSPGARGWRITPTGTRTPVGENVPGPAACNLRAHPVNPAAFGLVPGVYRPSRPAIVNGNTDSAVGVDATPDPLAAAKVVTVGPNAFAGAFGSNESAARIWLMFFDSNVVPPNGTQPTSGLSFNLAPNATFNFVAPLGGLYFAKGLTWVASSTPDTLTAVAVGPVARVTTLGAW